MYSIIENVSSFDSRLQVSSHWYSLGSIRIATPQAGFIIYNGAEFWRFTHC